jgi:3-oxoadipate enol-lactonase
MPYADLSLAKVYYESIGDGPPLVFAHGAGGNALSWWQQTAFFSAGFRCITFDHPGFRNSSWSVPENDPKAFYGNVLAQLLDNLELDTVGLVAQSMGGWTCLRFAIDHPDRTAALVMAATDGGLYLPSREHYSNQMAALDGSRKAWAEKKPGSFHPACGSRMQKEQPALHDMYVEINSQNGDLVRRGWSEVSADELSRLQCPTLFITGAEDIVCPPERVEALAVITPNPEFVKIPESGHSVYFERAEEFNRLVDSFLSVHFPFNSSGSTIMSHY